MGLCVLVGSFIIVSVECLPGTRPLFLCCRERGWGVSFAANKASAGSSDVGLVRLSRDGGGGGDGGAPGGAGGNGGEAESGLGGTEKRAGSAEPEVVQAQEGQRQPEGLEQEWKLPAGPAWP